DKLCMSLLGNIDKYYQRFNIRRRSDDDHFIVGFEGTEAIGFSIDLPMHLPGSVIKKGSVRVNANSKNEGVLRPQIIRLNFVFDENNSNYKKIMNTLYQGAKVNYDSVSISESI